MSQLRLSLLGPPQVWADDIPLTFATRKALALLIYLVVEGGPQPRDKLLALLWSDSAPERGRGVLRTTLAYLRRALDTPATINSATYLTVEADTIAFVGAPASVAGVPTVGAAPTEGVGKIGVAAEIKANYDLDLKRVESALAATPTPLNPPSTGSGRGPAAGGAERTHADAPTVGTPAGSPTYPSQLTLLEQAVALYRGDFLTGFSLPDAPDFD